jgi:hypothetical protein
LLVFNRGFCVGPVFLALMETSRSLQIIALEDAVTNAPRVMCSWLDASKTMSNGRLGRFRRMANGLHKERVGRKFKPSSSVVITE